MAKASTKKSPTKAEVKAAVDATEVPETAPTADTAQADTAIEAATDAMAQSNSDPILVFDELLDNCRAVSKGFADQSSKESDRDFVLRVFTVISDMPEDGSFEAMQQKTQDWYNEAAAAESEGKPWEMPEGFVSKFGKGAAPAKEPKAPKAAAEPKAAKPAKVVEPKAPKPPGIVARARRLVLLNLTANLAKLMELAKENGLEDIKQPTMAAVFTDTHATIGLAIELGLWKK